MNVKGIFTLKSAAKVALILVLVLLPAYIFIYLDIISKPNFVLTQDFEEDQRYFDSLLSPQDESCPGSIGFEAIGSLGDVMFEIAAAVGVCVFRGLEPTKCVSMAPTGQQGLVVNNAIDQFNILFLKTPRCERTFKNLYKEASRDKIFDRNVMFVPTDTKLKGYWQSHRYFYPHADKHIRFFFSFSMNTVMSANELVLDAKSRLDEIYLSRKSQLLVPERKFSLVCMSVQSGINNNWSLSSQYYRDAIEFYREKYANLGIVIFYGGENTTLWDSSAAWIESNIVNHFLNSSIYFLNLRKHDSFDTFAALSMCPNIIISVSTLGWWSGYLANHTNVVAPQSISASTYMKIVPQDYYPSSWTLISDRENKKRNLPHSQKPSLLSPKPKIAKSYRGGSNYTTVVTSFYEFKTKHNFKHARMWMSNFMAMDFKTVIFTNEHTYKKHLLKLWPPSYRRRYILTEINELEVSKMRINWTYQLSLNNVINQEESVLKVSCNKVFFLSEVVKKNPFGTDAFAWIDIDAFRDEWNTSPWFNSFPLNILELVGLPNPSKFNLNKVTFSRSEDTRLLDNTFVHNGGENIAGGSTALIFFADLFRRMMVDVTNKDGFVGNSQRLYSLMAENYPYLVTTVDNTHKSKWFSMWTDASPDVNTPYAPRLFMDHNQTLEVVSAFREGGVPKLSNVMSKIRKANAHVKEKNSSRCDVFFGIVTTAKNAKLRDAIREGWISVLSSIFNRFSFQYKFFVGWDKSIGSIETNRVVELENAIYNDIVVLPFFDTYFNLTTKVGLMIKYSEANFNCEYIFKIDDDIRLNGNRMANLVDDLRTKNKELLYGGFFHDQITGFSRVVRDINNKYRLSYEAYPDEHFKPYAGGPLYFLSRKLVKSLNYTIVHRQLPHNDIVESVPSYYFCTRHDGLFKLEDAFLGDMIWKMSQSTHNITLYHVKHIFEYSGCEPGCVPPYISKIDEKNLDLMRLPFESDS